MAGDLAASSALRHWIEHAFMERVAADAEVLIRPAEGRLSTLAELGLTGIDRRVSEFVGERSKNVEQPLLNEVAKSCLVLTRQEKTPGSGSMGTFELLKRCLRNPKPPEPRLLKLSSSVAFESLFSPPRLRGQIFPLQLSEVIPKKEKSSPSSCHRHLT
jgi:hypothetical protein